MKEEELLCAHQVGDVINILQRATHHMYDPDKLLEVSCNLWATSIQELIHNNSLRIVFFET